MMIRKQGSQYVLYTKDGSRVLGRHNSRDAAEKQEKAIKASERKKKR